MVAKRQTPIRSMTALPPTPSEIKTARKQARCTVREAAILVYVPTAFWRDCEAGILTMHPAVAQLFALKTGISSIDDIRAIYK